MTDPRTVGSGIALQRSSEVAVRAMHLRDKPKRFADFEVDALLCEQVLTAKLPEVVSFPEERGENMQEASAAARCLRPAPR